MSGLHGFCACLRRLHERESVTGWLRDRGTAGTLGPVGSLCIATLERSSHPTALCCVYGRVLVVSWICRRVFSASTICSRHALLRQGFFLFWSKQQGLTLPAYCFIFSKVHWAFGSAHAMISARHEAGLFVAVIFNSLQF